MKNMRTFLTKQINFFRCRLTNTLSNHFEKQSGESFVVQVVPWNTMPTILAMLKFLKPAICILLILIANNFCTQQNLLK